VFFAAFYSDLYSESWRFGATDVHKVSLYEWLDGSLSKETFFRSGYPDKDVYDCLYFFKGTWIDNDCDYDSPFICSRELGRFIINIYHTFLLDIHSSVSEISKEY
jgi:hypothetical protein